MMNIIAFVVLEIYVVLCAYGFIGEGVWLGRVFKSAGVLLDNPVGRFVRAFAAVQILERVMLLAALESVCFWLIVDLMDGSASVVGICFGVAAAFLVMGTVFMFVASLIGSGATFERGFVALLKSVDEPVKLAKGVRSVNFSNRLVTYLVLDIVFGEGEALRRYGIADGGLVKAIGRGGEADSKSAAGTSGVDESGKAESEGIDVETDAKDAPEGIDELGSHDDSNGIGKIEG